MLEHLLINNFQKWKRLRVEFDPYVTTFVGTNDVGKSTIIRALFYLCLNPSTSTDKIIHWDADTLLLKLTLDGRHVVKRRRGRTGVNVYSLDGKDFAAFGAGQVPVPVSELLNTGPTNFQRQSDPYFWFSDTSGQVSKKLNEIINLSAIDRTLSNISSLVRRTHTEVSVARERLLVARTDVKRLSWVPEFEQGLKDVEETKKHLDEKSHTIASLRVLLESCRKSRLRKESLANAALGGKKLGSTAKRLLAVREQYRKLGNILTNLWDCQEAKSRPIPDDVHSLLAMRKQADSVAERRRSLEALVVQLREVKEKACQAKEAVTAVRLSLGKICPTCGLPTSLSRSSRTYT